MTHEVTNVRERVAVSEAKVIHSIKTVVSNTFTTDHSAIGAFIFIERILNVYRAQDKKSIRHKVQVFAIRKYARADCIEVFQRKALCTRPWSEHHL